MNKSDVKIIKLHQTRGMLRKIATAHIAKQGYYTCNIQGQKTKVVA